MSHSNLTDHVRISPNSSNPRNAKINAIVIHHMAGNLTVEKCGEVFAPTSRQASSNYGVGTDGRIGCYVEEENRAWTSGNREIDNRAITIEVANCSGDPDWKVSDQALESTIALCYDVCRRYGFKLTYTGDKSGSLHMHKWYQATGCPGPYLESKFAYIAEEVNKRLGNNAEVNTEKTIYRVQTGAFSSEENAKKQVEQLRKLGIEGFIVSEKVKTEVKEEVKTEVKTMSVGSLVRLKKGARDYNGGKLADFVYERNHRVKSISGDRVVITYNNVVIAAVKKTDLTLL
jgi:hypothetical protein